MKELLLLMVAVSIACSQQQERKIGVERENSASFYGGMGVHIVRAADFVDYINTIATPAQRVDDFGTAVGFFGGFDVPIGEGWGIAVEHQYLFKSYSISGNLGGIYDLYYSVQAPSILLQKVLKGKGYFLKLSGGGGYHVGAVTHKVSTFGVTTEYTSEGIGLTGEAAAQTAFGDDLYGYIGGTVAWHLLGELKDRKGAALTIPRIGTAVSMRVFHAGIRFGIVQYL